MVAVIVCMNSYSTRFGFIWWNETGLNWIDDNAIHHLRYALAYQTLVKLGYHEL